MITKILSKLKPKTYKTSITTNKIFLFAFLFLASYGNSQAKSINFPVKKEYSIENYINKADFRSVKKYQVHSDIMAYGINIATGLTFIYTKDASSLINFGFATLSIIGLKELTKASVSRYRPDLSKDNSFFSGHTSISFNAATLLTLKYGLKAGIIAIPVAIYAGYSRIMGLKHYPSDVLVGAIMGILNAFIWMRIKRLRFKLLSLAFITMLPYIFIAFY